MTDTDTTAQYQPGDIANGHVLGADGVWRPQGRTPLPLPPKPKKPVYRRWYAWTAYVLVALGILATLGGGGDADTTEGAGSATVPAPAHKAGQPAPARPVKQFDLAVKAGVLVSDFEDNELAADQRYDGKTLKVSGVVDKIDTDFLDDSKYILRLTNGSDFALLSVNVEGLSQDELAPIDAGDHVSVIADFDDGGDLGVEMSNGRLVR